MKGFIETISPLRKNEGTRLPVNKSIYTFSPNEHRHYVCEVLSEDDYATILSISAGYRPYDQHKDYPDLVPISAAAVSTIPNTRSTPPVPVAVKKMGRPKGSGKGRPVEALNADPAAG